MTVEKPKPKQLLHPITAGANSTMNESQFLEITCNSLKAREKSRIHGAIGFGFASHCLKNCRESSKPTIKSSNCHHVITLDSHLETALSSIMLFRHRFISSSTFTLLRPPRGRSWTPPSRMYHFKIPLAIEWLYLVYLQPSDNLLWALHRISQDAHSEFGFFEQPFYMYM